jgi:hypothetical protein
MPIERKPLPRTIRGGRQFFFDDPAIDKLVSMLLALSGEVWVLRERLAAVEGVAAAKRAFTTEDVEGYEFSPSELQRLGAMRGEFIGNLFRVLDERVDAARSAGGNRPKREESPSAASAAAAPVKRARSKPATRRHKKAAPAGRKTGAVASRGKGAKARDKRTPGGRKRTGTRK